MANQTHEIHPDNESDFITQAQATKIAGVSSAQMAQMRKSKKWAAMFMGGTRVFIHHPLWKQYLQDRAEKGALPQATPESLPVAFQGTQAGTPLVTHPPMTTLTAAKLDKLKQETRKIEIARQKLEGELVPFEVMDRLVLDYMENLNRRLLNLGGNVVDRILQLAIGSGQGARTKVMEMITTEVSRELQEVQKDIVHNLEKYKEQL